MLTIKLEVEEDEVVAAGTKFEGLKGGACEPTTGGALAIAAAVAEAMARAEAVSVRGLSTRGESMSEALVFGVLPGAVDVVKDEEVEGREATTVDAAIALFGVDGGSWFSKKEVEMLLAIV